ncbi:MAG: hypothetical protein WBE75_01945 [Candidatus Omnitrophota bacterium]
MRIWCGMKSSPKSAGRHEANNGGARLSRSSLRCFPGSRRRLTRIFAAAAAVVLISLSGVRAETQRFIKHGDGIMKFVTVNSPFPAVYMFEMPPAWAPEGLPAEAVDGSWYGRHINEDVRIRIIPFDNSANLKLGDIAKLVKKQYFNDGECSLDDFHKAVDYEASIEYPYEAYFYENCPPGKVNFFVICDIGSPQVVIFNLYCSGEKWEYLGKYFEDMDRVMRRFKWEAK